MEKSVRPRLVIDENRAFQIFSILEPLWKNRTGIYKGVNLSEDLYPVQIQDPVKLANYFFYCAIPQRGGVNSDSSFRWTQKMYQLFPEMFDPFVMAAKYKRRPGATKKWLVRNIQTATKEILGNEGIGLNGCGPFGYKIDEHLETWCLNSVALAEGWHGNVLNVYEGVTDFEQAFGRINYKDRKNKGQAFVGMRRKIFSLLTIWCQKSELIPVFPTPIPVDFHALRALYITNIISFDPVMPYMPKNRKAGQVFVGLPAVTVRDHLVTELIKWSQTFIWSHGFSHMHINPALWIISRELCADHAQNFSDRTGGIIATDVFMKANPEYWGPRDPCQICPISQHCQYMMPAFPYFKASLLYRYPRLDHPLSRQTTIPLEEVEQMLAEGWRGRKSFREGDRKRPATQAYSLEQVRLKAESKHLDQLILFETDE